MLTRHVAALVLTALILVAVATSGQAQISSASALFLRIAPGARAAAMGETFVAVADDATATYWNPAGLGAYPLSDSWKDAPVPQHLRPLQQMAVLKKGQGSDYQSYEIWAISAQGLVRYDYRNWTTDEVFSTRTTETVSKKVARYFNEKDEERRAVQVAAVVEANSRLARTEFVQLGASIVENIPADYPRRAAIADGFDSLLAAYDECRVNWDRFETVRRDFSNGMKDSSLSEVECDRLNIAVANAKSRFIPEELKIPYSAMFDGELTCIASSEKSLLVGTTNGLYFYNGKSWRTMTVLDGLPSPEITALYVSPSGLYVGTSKGLVILTGATIIPVPGSESLPGGRVSAIGPAAKFLWTVVDNDLYSFDGDIWSNSFAYTVALDDTPETIAERFAIYGTGAEVDEFVAKMFELNKRSAMPSPEAEVIKEEEEVPSQTTQELVVDSLKAALAETDPTADETEEPTDTAAVDEAPAMPPRPLDLNALQAGDVIQVPYLARIRGEATSIHSSGGWTWIGTEYGLVLLYGDSSRILGYGDHVVTQGENLDSLIARRGSVSAGTAEADLYRQALIAVNGLEGGTLRVGDTIRVYRNATASRINKITGSGRYVYLATADGLRYYDRDKRRVMSVNQKGLNRATAISVEVIGDELWMASEDRIVAKANARSKFTLMHVKWLPELASDMFYDFFSYVQHVDGWGTVGGNITFLYYGSIDYTDKIGTVVGTDEPYELAVTLSYGSSLTNSLKGGISAKLVYSRLAEGELAAGTNTNDITGDGSATGVAFDLGLLYHLTPRLNLGMNITNLGPEIQYSQDAQSDPLPRNLAIGFAYKLLQSDYNRLLITGEFNKQLISIGNFSEEARETILSAGAEFVYADLIALRAGYKHDEEGKIKILTLGLGLTLMDRFGFDFSYIPSNSGSVLANILRISLSISP